MTKQTAKSKWINDEGHIAMSYPLDIDSFDGKIVTVGMKPATIIKSLRAYLKKDLRQAEHCDRCGSLLPELVFIFEKKKYCFTCFEITDLQDSILNETDYDKLLWYLLSNHIVKGESILDSVRRLAKKIHPEWNVDKELNRKKSLKRLMGVRNDGRRR